jgi:hypothetical protein
MDLAEQIQKRSDDARLRGWHAPWTVYVDSEWSFIIQPAAWAQLREWCRPALDRRVEIGGLALMRPEQNQAFSITEVWKYESAYLSATTVDTESDDLQARIKEERPGIELTTNTCCSWHLHPGHFGRPLLSVGDVMEVREACQGEDGYAVSALLIYGNPVTQLLQPGAYIIKLDRVERCAVVIAKEGA